jgi:hypothetical protein
MSATGKRELLAELLATHRLTVGVETGIYNGGGSLLGMHPDPLDELFVLDLQPANIEQVHANFPTVTTVCGDSAWTMPAVVRRIYVPALFWLDAHLVADLDTPGQLDAFPCPLYDELAQIVWHMAATGNRHVVAIDDLHLMGQNGWPTLDQLRAHVDQPGLWRRRELDAVMVLEPA